MASDSELEAIQRHGKPVSNELILYKLEELVKQVRRVEIDCTSIKSDGIETRLWKQRFDIQQKQTEGQVKDDYERLHAHIKSVDKRVSPEQLQITFIPRKDIKLILIGILLAGGAGGMSAGMFGTLIKRVFGG